MTGSSEKLNLLPNKRKCLVLNSQTNWLLSLQMYFFYESAKKRLNNFSLLCDGYCCFSARQVCFISTVQKSLNQPRTFYEGAKNSLKMKGPNRMQFIRRQNGLLSWKLHAVKTYLLSCCLFQAPNAGTKQAGTWIFCCYGCGNVMLFLCCVLFFSRSKYLVSRCN